MTDRTKFGLWGAGVLAVFLFHVAALVDAAATGGGHGARVWSILLLIAAPVSVVLFIGGGVARLTGKNRSAGGADGSESKTNT